MFVLFLHIFVYLLIYVPLVVSTHLPRYCVSGLTGTLPTRMVMSGLGKTPATEHEMLTREPGQCLWRVASSAA